jgi:molybdopterin molybdotransferase
VPAFDNAAVDGWAFAHGDLGADGCLPCAEGRAAAGHAYTGSLPAGHALRVLTGAVMPEGADTVAMQEEVTIEGGHVGIPPGLKAGANRRRRGEDIAEGAVALARGRRLGPPQLGVAAETGRDRLLVHVPLRVALFSSGDELVEPGGPLGEGRVYDANRHLLRALLAPLPCVVTDLGILPDEEGPVRAALAEAGGSHDLVLTSGGASGGDEDHVVRSVRALGSLHFWQIRMKPGRPLALGQLGRAVFVGLPGNPVAAAVCFARLARPVLLRLAGAAFEQPRAFPVRAAFAMRKKPGRMELVRATLAQGPDGPRAHRVPREGSGILTSLTEADGLVELDEDLTAVDPGDLVPFLPFTELGLAP